MPTAYNGRRWLKVELFFWIPGMYFELIGEISDVEVIAVGGNIADIMRLRRQFGPGRWRKLKGIAAVRTDRGNIRLAELHWYEAHGIGRKKMKIKRFLD